MAKKTRLNRLLAMVEVMCHNVVNRQLCRSDDRVDDVMKAIIIDYVCVPDLPPL
jgi:hypothetical protein